MDETIRAIILEQMQKQGFNQYRLGKRAGVEQSAISRFVQEDSDVRLSTVQRLVDALGLRLVKSRKR